MFEGWFSRKGSHETTRLLDVWSQTCAEDVDGEALLERVGELLCQRYRVEWLAFYVVQGDHAERVALVTPPEEAASADEPESVVLMTGGGAAAAATQQKRVAVGQPELVEEAIPRRVRTELLVESETARPAWLPLGPGHVWVFLSDPAQLGQVVHEQAEDACALARVVELIAQSRGSARREREGALDQRLQAEVLKATAGADESIELFLRTTLAGLGAQHGCVALFSQDGALRSARARCGEVSEALEGLSVEVLGPVAVATVTDAAALAPSARAIYALARSVGESVLVVVAASDHQVSTVDERAETAIEAALDVIAGVIGAEHELERTRQRHRKLAEDLARLVDADDAGGDHRLRVGRVALWAAAAFGLGGADLVDLERAALIHDVGRSATAADPTGTAIEFLHPDLGAQVLETLGERDAVVHMVRNHHRRADGMGFPPGPSPEEDELGCWALIAAEAIVELSEREGLSLAAAGERWLERAGSDVLPKLLLPRLRQAAAQLRDGD